MKKTIALTIIVCMSLITAKAQLANTKWKGIVKIPSQSGVLEPYGMIFEFQQDTARVIYDNADMGIEVMAYTADGATVTFRKISGGVPCDTIALLTCSYKIKNDQLYLKMTRDACKARSQADASQPFDRVK
jgi:hypothetical protein